MTLSPGRRRFAFWMAHLALLVLLMQVVAVDHWSVALGETAGFPASDHAAHCHGTSSCGDGGAMTPPALATALTPLQPEPRRYDIKPSVLSHADAFVATLLEPPRAA